VVESVQHFCLIVKLLRDFIKALNNLGEVLRLLEHLIEAIFSLEEVTKRPIDMLHHLKHFIQSLFLGVLFLQLNDVLLLGLETNTFFLLNSCDQIYSLGS